MIHGRVPLNAEIAVKPLFHILATFAVLAHMLCGCCWHHAHGADSQDHVATAGCHDHHHAPLAEGCADHDSFPHDHGDPCDKSVCDFARTDRGPSLESASDGHFDVPPVADESAQLHRAMPAVPTTVAGPDPPLPRYLAHQTLLL